VSDETIKTAVMIETSRHQIVGNIALPTSDRISDYANDPTRRFWAITEAQIAPLDDPGKLREVDFVLVAAHEIGLIRPGWGTQKAVEAPSPFGEFNEISQDEVLYQRD
jgi:hypothetical protein